MTGTATLSKEQALEALLDRVIESRELHCKWLNTLSYMEHVGASKIAKTQSGEHATFMVLKHASEEARHAFYLKKLCHKLDSQACPDYNRQYLLAPTLSKHYLHKLDLAVSRMIIERDIPRKYLKELAYLLVTYAIEVKADALYPVYQRYLSDYPVKLSVLSIINEEVGHLEEMNRALSHFPLDTKEMQAEAVKIEEALFNEWVTTLQKELL